jgi:hypothetical protein
MKSALLGYHFQNTMISSLTSNSIGLRTIGHQIYYDKFFNFYYEDIPFRFVESGYIYFDEYVEGFHPEDEEGIKRMLNYRAICLGFERNLPYYEFVHPKTRGKVIDFYSDNEPALAKYLKESFFRDDLISFCLSIFLPDFVRFYGQRFQKELLAFKSSLMKEYFQSGIDMLFDEHKGGYEVSEGVKNSLKSIIHDSEQRILELAKVYSVKDYDTKSISDDIFGTMAGFILQYLPFGSIKELYSFLERSNEFRDNKYLNFVLALMTIARIVNAHFDLSDTNSCIICNSTDQELNNLVTDESTLEFLNEHFENFCMMHKMIKVDIRKKYKLMGKKLIMAIKRYK